MATSEHQSHAGVHGLEELIRVRAYKKGRLVEFGYSDPDAEELSEWGGTGVDIHYVQALIARGATLAEAARIAR